MILLKRAVLAFRSGDKQAARDLLIEAAEHNPDNELVWLWRASAARTRAEALDAVDRVLGLNPKNEKALQWVTKLRPGFVAPEQEESRTQAEPAPNGGSNGSSNGVAQVDAEEEEQESASAAAEALEAEAASEATSEEESAEVVIETSAAADSEVEIEAEAAGESEQVEDRGPEPPADAEARLAALEAYLQRGGREEAEVEDDQAATEVEGYSFGGRSDLEEDRERESQAGADEEDPEDRDPLLALLEGGEEAAADGEEESYREAVDGEPESDPARDQEYRERLEQLESRRAAEDDVWASLGMAGMERKRAPAAAAETLENAAPAKAKAAVMGVAEGAAATPAAEQDGAVGDTVRVNDEGEPEDQGCFICEKLAPQQDGVCSSCRSIVDIKLHELAPRHEGADRGTLVAAFDRVRAQIDKGPSAELCIQAALVCLNMKQSHQALGYLREACRLRPHDRDLVGHYDQLEKRPLILAVDDSKTVQKMISTVLEKESYRVLAAEDGLAALAKLDEEMPELILLDITMPRMDGYQVCKVINGNDATKHIPVIMLSGKDGFFDKVRGKMVGASNYITKPFDPNDLTKTIAKFLKKNK